MLKFLLIRNFQKHKRIKLEFDPHITSIVGASDKGKSSILRALIWATTNKPSGDAFIKEGTDQTKVVLGAEENKICRLRGKTTNEYSLNGEVFKAFGNEVPPEISQVLNIDNTNIQNQHDSPWWFTESAGEISRQLNKIVNLSIMDTTLANLDKMGRDTKAKIKVLESQEKELKATKKELEWVKTAEKDNTNLNELYAEWKNLSKNSHSMSEQLKAIERYTDTLNRSQVAILDGKTVIQKGVKLENIQNKRKRLKKLLFDISEFQKVNLEPRDEILHLIDLLSTLIHYGKEKKRIEQSIFNFEFYQAAIKQSKKDLEKAKTEFKTEMGDTCQLCGQKL